MFFTLFSKKNLFDQYWAAKELENSYVYAIQSDTGNCSFPQQANDQVITDQFESINDTMLCAVYPKIMSNDSTRTNILQRQFHMLMIKTNNATCKRDLPAYSCPIAPSLDPSDVNKTPLGNGTDYWRTYHSASQNGIEGSVIVFSNCH